MMINFNISRTISPRSARKFRVPNLVKQKQWKLLTCKHFLSSRRSKNGEKLFSRKIDISHWPTRVRRDERYCTQITWIVYYTKSLLKVDTVVRSVDLIKNSFLLLFTRFLSWFVNRCWRCHSTTSSGRLAYEKVVTWSVAHCPLAAVDQFLVDIKLINLNWNYV